MKIISENEHTLTLTDEKGAYKIISPDYSETYGSLSLQDGCQVEDLIAICYHHVEGEQKGNKASLDNMEGLFHLNLAMEYLKGPQRLSFNEAWQESRLDMEVVSVYSGIHKEPCGLFSSDCKNRGVEGTNQK